MAANTSRNTKTATPTKSETLRKLLARKSGASIAQLQAATSWQPHSVRAALSGFRKKGAAITRSSNGRGITIYRLSSGPD